MFFSKCFVYNLSSYRNKRVTVIELQKGKKENLISYSLIKKIKYISIEQISNNDNLLIPQVILKKEINIIRYRVYIS